VEPAIAHHQAADVDERFFADGDKPLARTGGGKTTFSDLDEPDLRSMLKNAPGAQKRRERYARFVRWVLVAGVLVLTAGLVRVAIAKREYQPIQKPVAVAPPRAESPAAEQPASSPAPQAAQLTGSPVQEAPAATAQPEGAKPADEAPAPAAATASGTPEENAKEAKLAKKESQHALEVGKTSQSIEAGERAVSLDPTDAESWLILGAAYQQAGKLADAKRCFKSCLTLGTHGPKGECAAFPH
jgi:Flp pilus assembly protein TadD